MEEDVCVGAERKSKQRLSGSNREVASSLTMREREQETNMKEFTAICVPPQIGWIITDDCDYAKCRFCYSPDYHKAVDGETTNKIAEEIIKKARQYSRCHNEELRVVVSGGEPLRHEDAISIIKKFKDNGIKTTLATNGNLLLEQFPEYQEYLDVIALPLEGTKERDEDIRGSGHYDKVMNILEGTHGNIKIKIETVILPDTAVKDLEHIYKICEKYKVRSWKLLEYNHYSKRNNYQSSDCYKFKDGNDKVGKWVHEKKGASGWIVYEKKEDRDCREFIISGNGTIYMPSMDDNDKKNFTDKQLGNVLLNFDKGIKTWWSECNVKKVQRHYKMMNDPESGLYADKQNMTKFDKKLLSEGSGEAGLFRVYKNNTSFHKYRRFDEAIKDGMASLEEYLHELAENEVTMISHGMSSGLGDLIRFLKRVYIEDKKSQFKFTLILPQPYCYADIALSEATGKDAFETISYIEKRIQKAKDDIKIETGAKEVPITIKYTKEIIYGSTILIDDRIIQTETKYAGVLEDDNLILEIRKTPGEASYFDRQLEGIKNIAENCEEKGSGKALTDSYKVLLAMVIALVVSVHWGYVLLANLTELNVAIILPPTATVFSAIVTMLLGCGGKMKRSILVVLKHWGSVLNRNREWADVDEQ